MLLKQIENKLQDIILSGDKNYEEKVIYNSIISWEFTILVEDLDDPVELIPQNVIIEFEYRTGQQPKDIMNNLLGINTEFN